MTSKVSIFGYGCGVGVVSDYLGVFFLENSHFHKRLLANDTLYLQFLYFRYIITKRLTLILIVENFFPLPSTFCYVVYNNELGLKKNVRTMIKEMTAGILREMLTYFSLHEWGIF